MIKIFIDFIMNPRDVLFIIKNIKDLRVPKSRECVNGSVLIDVNDSVCELIEQLSWGKYVSELKKCKVLSYHPVLTKKRLFISRIFRWLTPLIFSKGMFVSYIIGVDRCFDDGLIEKCDIEAARKEAEIFRFSIKTKRDVLEYKFLGIEVGLSIYDTYLKEMRVGTLDIKDEWLYFYAFQAFLIAISANKFLEYKNVRYIFFSHVVYNSWKIVSDIAIKKDIQVFVTYNSPKGILHRVNDTRGLQTADHSRYRSLFASHSEHDKKLFRSLGESLIKERLLGVIDDGISYMGISPYSGKSTMDHLVDQKKSVLVLALHSFFDSPHIYNGMVFTDFFEWITLTLEFIEKNNILVEADVFLKPHPNRFPEENVIISEIVKLYPFVKIVPDNVSNKEVAAIAACVVTVYGTIIPEFSYLGVPVIACGDNPTSSYPIAFEANSESDYFTLLKSYRDLSVDNSCQEFVSEFMYMHYLNDRNDHLSEYPIKRSTRHPASTTSMRMSSYSYHKFANYVFNATKIL